MRSSRLAAWLMLVLLLGPPSAGRAAEGIRPDIIAADGVLLRLDQVDLAQVVDLYSRITDKVVIPSPDLKGKVTIINRHRVPPDEAARLIESAWELQGLTIVPQGKIVKLVKSKDAVKRLLPTVTPLNRNNLSQVDRMQTHLIPLHHAKAEEVRTMIAPLLSAEGTMQVNERTNLMVITEVGTNMSRLFELIEKVDRPLNLDEETFESVQLVHVGPKKMVDDIRDYFKGTSLTWLPNERLQILVITGKRSDVARCRQVIEQLDRAVSEEQTINQIVRIQYAKAPEVADLLNKLYRGRIDPPPPSFSVNADKASNSLIITGPADLRAEVANLVHQIDIRYDQVLLKVLIGEVTHLPSRDLGVQWEVLGNASDLAQNINGALGSIGSSALRTSTVGLRYSVIHPNGYSHFVNALEQGKDFNVLASPQITVETNKVATFKVTDQVPVQTAERLSDNSNVTVRSNEFKEVGLTLKVSPAVTPGREISLDLDFTFSEVGARDPVFQNPTFSNRQTQTNVIIADRHTLLIAGLMRRDHGRVETRVPLLGRLPAIGPLFRNRSDTNTKQELLVLLTPDIMATPEEADRVSLTYERRAFRDGAGHGYRPLFDKTLSEMEDRPAPLLSIRPGSVSTEPIMIMRSPGTLDPPILSPAPEPAHARHPRREHGHHDGRPDECLLCPPGPPPMPLPARPPDAPAEVLSAPVVGPEPAPAPFEFTPAPGAAEGPAGTVSPADIKRQIDMSRERIRALQQPAPGASEARI